jgi:hypothetical protein
VKQRILSGTADYIVDYVININQKRLADVSVAGWENNMHGVVFGIAV